jgi:hypothetical protein
MLGAPDHNPTFRTAELSSIATTTDRWISITLGMSADVCYRLPFVEIAARNSDTTATIRTLGEGVAFCEKMRTALSL